MRGVIRRILRENVDKYAEVHDIIRRAEYGSPPGLIYIGLSDMGLDSLPEIRPYVGNKLIRLFLDNNNFGKIPSEILAFSHSLYSLSIRNNPLTELDMELIAKFPKLRSINVSGTGIRNVPSGLENTSVSTFELSAPIVTENMFKYIEDNILYLDIKSIDFNHPNNLYIVKGKSDIMLLYKFGKYYLRLFIGGDGTKLPNYKDFLDSDTTRLSLGIIKVRGLGYDGAVPLTDYFGDDSISQIYDLIFSDNVEIAKMLMIGQGMDWLDD